MFYRLGTPHKQSGVLGYVIPIEWSIKQTPFDTVFRSSIIVPGMIMNDTLVLDLDEMQEQIDEMERNIIMARRRRIQRSNVDDRVDSIRRGKLGDPES